jgi:hypothetical protein
MTRNDSGKPAVRRTILTHLLCAVLGMLLSTTVAFGEDDSTQRAKKTAEQFVQALKAEDLAATLKLAKTPFLVRYKTLKSTEHFQTDFAEFFDDKELGETEWKTVAAGKLDEVKDKLDEKQHYADLNAILKENDRVVLIEVRFGKNLEKTDLMAFAVAVESTKTKVIGFVD